MAYAFSGLRLTETDDEAAGVPERFESVATLDQIIVTAKRI
jgi:hypothetical protein